MSGPNQHSLPQMLQRGFHAKSLRDQTWLYKVDAPPSLERIADIGAEDHFYSSPTEDGPDLDGLITDYESRTLGTLLHKLKNASPSSVPAAEDAAEIVAHLTVRTGHFRTVVTEGFKSLGQDAVDLFRREDVVVRLFGFDRDQPTARFRELAQRIWQEEPRFGLAGMSFADFEQLIFALCKTNFSEFWAGQASSIQAFGELLAQRTPPIVRDGHNQALAQDFRGGLRKADLETFAWSFEAPLGPGAILPDCAAIAIVAGGDALPLMMADRENLRGVVAPISSTRLLIGRGPADDEIDLSAVNHQLAACSDSFFVAASEAQEFEVLIGMIGTRSRLVLDEALNSALTEFKFAPDRF